MSTQAIVAVTFEKPTNYAKNQMSINLLYQGFTAAGMPLDLIDKYQLPLVSNPINLPDWQRDLTEEEYLQIIGPPDLNALMVKHRAFGRRVLFWQKNKNHYSQIEGVFDLIREFEQGNKPVRYTLTVSDMG